MQCPTSEYQNRERDGFFRNSDSTTTNDMSKVEKAAIYYNKGFLLWELTADNTSENATIYRNSHSELKEKNLRKESSRRNAINPYNVLVVIYIAYMHMD